MKFEVMIRGDDVNELNISNLLYSWCRRRSNKGTDTMGISLLGHLGLSLSISLKFSPRALSYSFKYLILRRLICNKIPTCWQ